MIWSSFLYSWYSLLLPENQVPIVTEDTRPTEWKIANGTLSQQNGNWADWEGRTTSSQRAEVEWKVREGEPSISLFSHTNQSLVESWFVSHVLKIIVNRLPWKMTDESDIKIIRVTGWRLRKLGRPRDVQSWLSKMYRKSFTASNASNEAYADAFSGKHPNVEFWNIIIKQELQINKKQP